MKKQLLYRTGGMAAVLSLAMLLTAIPRTGQEKEVALAATAAPAATASVSSSAAPTPSPDGDTPISVMDAPVEERVTRNGLIYEYTGLYATLIGCTDAARQRTSITVPAQIAVNDIYYEVTVIDGAALKGCTNLSKVTLGKNLRQIRYSAFQGDMALSRIVFKGKKLSQVGNNAFKNTADMPVFRMPASVKKKYKKLIKQGKPSGWSTYKKL